MCIKKCFALLPLILSVSLVACVEKISLPEFNAQYYPECYDPITKLCQGKLRKDDFTLFRTLNAKKSENWSDARIVAELSYNCYEKQLAQVKEAYQKKKINKEELIARMQEIKSGIANLNLLKDKTETTFKIDIADSDKFLKEEKEHLSKPKKKNSGVTKIKTESGSSTLKRASKKERELLEERLKAMDAELTKHAEKETPKKTADDNNKPK